MSALIKECKHSKRMLGIIIDIKETGKIKKRCLELCLTGTFSYY
jgi:hypothetical protein